MIKVNGENFVVTGSAGFIGSHIAEELVKQGKTVTMIDSSLDYDRWVDMEDPEESYEMGLNDPIFTNKLKEKWPWINYCQCFAYNYDIGYSGIDEVFNWVDVVFNEACSKCTVCRENPRLDLMTNAYGSFNIFDAARKDGAKVVHASTGSVYGEQPTTEQSDGLWVKLIREETQYAPKSFYGVSKLAGEQYLRAFKEYYGLRYVGLRYFHVFGPRQDAGPNGGVVAIFITKMLKGEPIVVFGDGNQTRSFTYVKDVVAANFHAANSESMEGQYYNVASGIQVSLNQLIDSLAGIIGVSPSVEYREARKGDIKYFNVSNAKLAASGYSQWSDFEDALRETVGWYRANS